MSDVSARGLFTMMAELQDEVDKLKVRQTSLEKNDESESYKSNIRSRIKAAEEKKQRIKKEEWKIEERIEAQQK